MDTDDATNTEAALIQALEAEYDLDTGFVGRIRMGTFDSVGLERLLALIKSIDLVDARTINRRMVALLWMIPTIMTWQEERVGKHGGDVEGLQRGIAKVEAALSTVLGTP